MRIEHGEKIADLRRRVNNLIRIGRVSEVDYATAKARVQIGKLTTDFLPWLTPSTALWIPLKKDEQVLVLSPNGDLQAGIILPALYYQSMAAPSSDEAKIMVVADIDHQGNQEISGNVDTQGTVSVQGEISTESGIKAKSDITTDGGVKAKSEVEGNGVKLSTHTHNVQYIGAGQGATPQTTTTAKPS